MKRRDSSDSNPSQVSSSSPSARGSLSSSTILGHFNAITSSIQRRLSGNFSSPSSHEEEEDDSQQPHFHESDPPLAPISLRGFSDTTTERIMTDKLAEDIRLMMPARLQVQEDWELVYSLDQHGVSLGTLYARSKSHNSPQAGYVVIVKDRKENIFGAYLSDYPHVHPHYYGTGECFLFKFTLWQHVHGKHTVATSSSATNSDPVLHSTSHPAIHKLVPPAHHVHHIPELQLPVRPSSRGSTDTTSSQYQFKGFSYTGLNDYMILCTPQFLSVGGGYLSRRHSPIDVRDGKYGLFLDDVFENGISSRCPSFGNEPLSGSGDKFKIDGVEVWRIGGSGGTTGFVYGS
jgi:hypothetical protein